MHNIINILNREQLITLLEWCDPDGCYNDDEHKLEFGKVATLTELKKLCIVAELTDSNLISAITR